jgi:hypothetical protein
MWTAMAVGSYLPGALLWGPTQWEQHYSQPWDVEVRSSSGKLLVIENKGIQVDGSVHVHKDQLDAMCKLQQMGRSQGARNLVLYGLPALGGGFGWPLSQALFSQAQLMYRPETLRSIVNRWSPYERRLPLPLAKVEPLGGSFRLQFNPPNTWPPRVRRQALYEVLHAIPRCEWGVPLGSGWGEPESDAQVPGRWLGRLRDLAEQRGEEDDTPPQFLWWPRP